MTPDLIYDQMIGMGMVKKLVFSYVGNPGVGLLRRVREAVENGWPRALEIEEHSHAAMANAYEAGAAGLPCAIFRGYRGAELAKVNPNIKWVECPFTGERLAAVPAIRPDVTFIHAQKADRKGNVLVEGIVGVQKEAVLAAKRAVVTVEEIVDDFDDLRNLCILRTGRCSDRQISRVARTRLHACITRPRQRRLSAMGRDRRRSQKFLVDGVNVMKERRRFSARRTLRFAA